MTLDELNSLDAAVAERELLHCCGSRRWAHALAAARPFGDVQVLQRDADTIWLGLDQVDWLEAFAAHPRIGDLDGSAGTSAGTSAETSVETSVETSPGTSGERSPGRSGESSSEISPGASLGTGRAGPSSDGADATGPRMWSAHEQAGMDTASDAIRLRLRAVNREYERRFGFIYIVCASGRNADELLAIAERRLKNPRSEELLTAAEEQRHITRIRLAKLMALGV